MKKLLKKIISVSLAITMVTTNVFAKDIVINGFTQYKDIENVNNNIIMKHDTLLDAMGVYYTFDTDNQRLTILHNDVEIVINRGSKIALVNGEEVNMGIMPKVLDNQTYNETLYIPVEFVAEQLGAITGNNDEKIQIKIDILNVVEPNLYGVTKDTVVYSYEDALNKAINNSNTIKKAQNDTESNKLQVEKSDDYITYLQMSSIMGKALTNEYVQALAGKNSLNEIIALEDEQVKFYEELIQMQLLSAIIGVEKTKDTINGMEEQSAILAQTYKNTAIMNELGMVSDFDLNSLAKSVEDLNSGIESLKLNLQNNKYTINNILGVSLEEDNYIDFNMKIEPLDLKIDSYARHAANNSFPIKTQKILKEQAQYEYDNFLAEGDGDIYYHQDKEEKKRALQNATMALTDAINSHELSIKEMYINAEMMAKNHNVLVDDYEKSIEDYNKAVLQYDLGNTTILDVDKANANVLDKFNAVRANVMDYENLKYMILNPDLLFSQSQS